MRPDDERRGPEDERSSYVTHDDLAINSVFAATLPIAPDADAHLLSEIRTSLKQYMAAETQAHRAMMVECAMRLSEIDRRLAMIQPPGAVGPRDPAPTLTPAVTLRPGIDLEK